MPIRKISKVEAEANKKKLQVLKSAGYNIKIDGSWGPWLEKQYRKVTSAKRGKTSLANVGVMALPVAGYGIAQLLEGLGSMSRPSISLPSISAPAAAMAAPVALTLAGPAYGLYETITGQNHLVNITPQERLAMTYAPDATRVNRPIAISRTRVGSQSRPVEEMYINPALFRSKILSMASEDTDDSDATQNPSWEIEDIPAFLPPEQDPENEEPEDNKTNKLADKVKNIFRRKKPDNPEQPKKRPLLKKALKVYRWSWGIPAAIDVVGNIAGMAKNPDTYSPDLKALDYRTRPVRVIWDRLGEFYNPLHSTTDSTTVTPPKNPDNLSKANLDTISQTPTLDSIRTARQKASLKYLDSLEPNL